MSFQFQLAVYNEGYTNLIPIGEYLRSRQEGGALLQPDLDDSAIFLEVDGKELLATSWNFGDLELIVLQCEEAYHQLKEKQEAIIRSGVLDQPVVPYLLFEPTDKGETLLSIFAIFDNDKARFAFPIDRITGSSQELWSYVREHREQLLFPPDRSPKYFTRVACPSHELITALEREAALGRQLFATIGHDMHWEMVS